MCLVLERGEIQRKPSLGNTVVEVHFWNALFGNVNSFCFDFSFISSILAKRFPLMDVFSFGKRKKSAGAKSGEYSGFVFDQKLTHNHRCVSWCIIMVQNPCSVFPQFYAFRTNCFTQLTHNFKIVFLIDRNTLWQEFMMHHAIGHLKDEEEVSQFQN